MWVLLLMSWARKRYGRVLLSSKVGALFWSRHVVADRGDSATSNELDRQGCLLAAEFRMGIGQDRIVDPLPYMVDGFKPPTSLFRKW